MLPKNVQTVENAHSVLRPKGLNPGWKRQGEFFFSPLTKKELKKFHEKHGRKLFQCNWGNVDEDYLLKFNSDNDLEESDHFAANVFRGEKEAEYVYGYITYDRHKPVFLENWHRVYYNNEIPSNGELFD